MPLEPSHANRVETCVAEATFGLELVIGIRDPGLAIRTDRAIPFRTACRYSCFFFVGRLEVDVDGLGESNMLSVENQYM